MSFGLTDAWQLVREPRKKIRKQIVKETQLLEPRACAVNLYHAVIS